MVELNRSDKKLFRMLVAQVMEREIPSFNRWTEKSFFIWPGELVFFEVRGSVYTFIVFSPHEQDGSRFTIDIGWSKLTRFPEIDMRPCDEDPWSESVLNDEEEFFTRLGTVMNKNDFWWSLVSQLSSNIESVVKDAVSKIKHHALPYLDKVSPLQK